MKTARQIAFEALMKIESQNSYSNLVVDQLIERNNLNRRDSAFATTLVYGVVERLLTLDFILSQFCSQPLDKLQASVRTVLRMGVYQLYFMESVTDNAAVNESVELIKYARNTKAAGLVNAVLRNCLRKFNFDEAISKLSTVSEQFCVRYSCPIWIVEEWIERFGKERTERFLKNSLGKPPLYVRVNTSAIDSESLVTRLQEEGITAFPDKHLPNCLLLHNASQIEASDAFQKGFFHVQDKASQLCIQYTGIRSGDIVLDVCSAPGGKTFTAAQYAGEQGKLYAFDLHQNRVNLIDQGAKRLHLGTVTTACQDARVHNPTIPMADVVLCDVVCSGFGVIRRKPEIKYKSREEIKRLPQIQLDILENAAHYVKPNGTLLYSTCTVNRDENEAVIETFLAKNPAFNVVLPDDDVAYHENGGITLFGDDSDTDGFFMCKMKKNGG